MGISVILSFKNEERNIPQLYSRVAAALNAINENGNEIIFINDASTDNSLKIITELIEKDAQVKCINMTRSFGVSECVIAGLSKSHNDYAVYLDSDLQDPPELIPEMLKIAKKSGVDVVKTHRTSRLGESRLKLFVTSIGYKYLAKFSSIQIEEEVGDFTLLSRRAIQGVLEHREQMPFLRGIIANLNYPSAKLDYVRDSRLDGASASKFRLFNIKWMRSHLDRTLISFSDVPLKISLAFGFFVSLLSFFGLFVDLFMKFLNLAVPGWATLVFIILFIGGVQLLIIGILGLYVNIIYHEVKKRPLYVIDNEIDSKGISKPTYLRGNLNFFQ